MSEEGGAVWRAAFGLLKLQTVPEPSRKLVS